MPIPEFIILTATNDDESFRLSDDDEDDGGVLADILDRHSFNSLQTGWSRWDESEAAMCGNSTASKINFEWGVHAAGNNLLPATITNATRRLADRLVSDANIPVERYHSVTSRAEQKLETTFPRRPGHFLTKARSLSPRPPVSCGKLRNSPPSLPRSPRCKLAPPKPPVRRLSMAPSEASSDFGCVAKISTRVPTDSTVSNEVAVQDAKMQSKFGMQDHSAT